MVKERQIEDDLIARLKELKYTYRPDIRDKATLEQNFREKFAALNQVELTDSEFSRLRSQIIHADVFTAAKILREINTFQRDDGPRCNIRWSILTTGAKTTLKSSISCASTPPTVTTATM